MDGSRPIPDSPGPGVELNDDFLAGQAKIVVRWPITQSPNHLRQFGDWVTG
ncbi:MAG: hypothetical protein WBO46_03975 [Caldilineaceae bacterium]